MAKIKEVSVLTKKNILFICDSPNWAFHLVARFVSENLSEKYNFYIDFTVSVRVRDYGRNANLKWYQKFKKRLIEAQVCHKYGDVNKYINIRNDDTYDVVILFEAYMERDFPFGVKYKKLVKGIYTDSYPPLGYPITFDYPVENFVQRFLSNSDAVILGCQNSVSRYSPFCKNIFNVNGYLDDKLFSSENKIKNDSFFVIGWTGNPKRTKKGFYTHVIPAVEILKQKYGNVVLKTKHSGSMGELADFYKDVDIVLIASEEDTGPSMFVEASLSGVPSVSTRVGVPLEIIQHEINGLFVERKIETMVSAVSKLYEDRELLNRFSERIRRDYITVLGKDKMIARWQKLFDFLFTDDTQSIDNSRKD